MHWCFFQIAHFNSYCSLCKSFKFFFQNSWWLVAMAILWVTHREINWSMICSDYQIPTLSKYFLYLISCFLIPKTYSLSNYMFLYVPVFLLIILICFSFNSHLFSLFIFSFLYLLFVFMSTSWAQIPTLRNIANWSSCPVAHTLRTLHMISHMEKVFSARVQSHVVTFKREQQFIGSSNAALLPAASSG